MKRNRILKALQLPATITLIWICEGAAPAQDVRKVKHPSPPANSTDPAVPPFPDPTTSVEGGWSATDCGISLKLEYMHTNEGGDSLILDLNWDTAPVLPLEDGDSSNPAVPSLESRRCTRKIHFTRLAVQRGQPVIADVRLSNARPGTPENGRWHALVLLAR